MEIPYEIMDIFKIDNKGFIIINTSTLKNIKNNTQYYYISEIIDSLGKSSYVERHLYRPIITSDLFFNSDNKKTIIIKIEKNLIIGFILYGYKPIILRNEFNLKYFSKILLTISDFYIYRPYQRMNYGKELFDKIIQMENIKPVSMAFEFPSRALINFLYKNYNINNPIYQINNVITYFNFIDENFNKYLDNYHRVIDVNKMENDIDNYRKWSPLNKDYKIYNSDYTYKNIFPLKFKNNKLQINNNRYSNNLKNNIRDIENNYFNKKINDNNNINTSKIRNGHSYDFRDNIKNKINGNNNSDNSFTNDKRNNFIQNGKQYNVLDEKDIYEKVNINNKNNNITLLNKNNNHNYKNNEYYFKFNDYYLNENPNYNHPLDNNADIYNKNCIKDNYYNHLNDENRFLKNILFKQKEKSDKLTQNINNLNNKIRNLSNKTPQKNNYNKDFYYHKNLSFATLFDSMHNKLQEEKDFNEYKKYQNVQDYSNYL